MKVNTVVALVSALLLTSCAKTKWVNERDSSANYMRDTAFCENEALRVVLPSPATALRQAPAPAPTPKIYRTNCSKWGDETNCTTTGTEIPQSKSKASAFLEGFNAGDANRSNSSGVNDYKKNCMTLKGWTTVRVPRS